MQALRLAAISLCLASTAFAGSGVDVPKPDPRPPVVQKNLEPVYTVTAGIDGEVFPVFANYASLKNVDQRKWGTVAVVVNNPTADVLRARISVQVQGWSDQEIQTVNLKAGAARTYLF